MQTNIGIGKTVSKRTAGLPQSRSRRKSGTHPDIAAGSPGGTGPTGWLSRRFINRIRHTVCSSLLHESYSQISLEIHNLF